VWCLVYCATATKCVTSALYRGDKFVQLFMDVYRDNYKSNTTCLLTSVLSQLVFLLSFYYLFYYLCNLLCWKLINLFFINQCVFSALKVAAKCHACTGPAGKFQKVIYNACLGQLLV
jgi:hypothetical protein